MVDARSPLNVVVVGGGNMGRKWLELVEASPHTQTAALVDIDSAGVRERLGATDFPVTDDLAGVLGAGGVDVLVNTTIPAAHHEVSRMAMMAGADVVSEKPAAETLVDGLRLAAIAHHTRRTMSVSQSRSLTKGIRTLTAAVAQSDALGTVRCTFTRGPRFGGFRDQMPHPLLVDMAIHPFDMARTATGAEPVSVFCTESNPAWSWYQGSAESTAIFEMSGGFPFVYSGSWCSNGAPTSWNGDWRVETDRGVLLWDGDGDVQRSEGEAEPVSISGPDELREGIACGFDEFIAAVNGGKAPAGAVVRNLGSMAMVEAAVESADTGKPVAIEDVYHRALDAALAVEADGAIRSVLPTVTAAAQSGHSLS